jgi:hypothetical protein
MQVAAGAFPPDCYALASSAALELSAVVDSHYSTGFTTVIVRGHTVQIPDRLHFRGKRDQTLYPSSALEPFVQCLLTRSTDGYERHAALRTILPLNTSWSIPFVLLLAGEYVVEIIDDIVSSLSLLDPVAYGALVRENAYLMSLLEVRATSYWDCYYRHSFADRHQYPGIKLLHQLGQWARQGLRAWSAA